MKCAPKALARTGLGLLLFGVALVLAPGCDSGPKRFDLSGQVLFDGKPLPAGEIYFDPDASKKHDGPQGFARIKDGRYDTRPTKFGVRPGPHVVRILGFDGVPGPEQPLGRSLFPEYSTTTDIPDKGDATIDFTVPPRKAGR